MKTRASRSFASRSPNRLRILFKEPSFGISALPKGLISWKQGFQYTSPGSVSRHQIMAQGPARESAPESSCILFSRGISSRDGCSSWNGHYRTGRSFFPWEGIILFDLVAMFLRSALYPTGVFPLDQGNLNDSIAKLLGEKPIATKTTTGTPGGSKGNQESFRRGLRDGAETPRRVQERPFGKWNSRRAYHEHPYFTTNLKYVY